jgi:hypothetical protein
MPSNPRFLAEADPIGWGDEIEAEHDYAETDRSHQGPI